MVAIIAVFELPPRLSFSSLWGRERMKEGG